MRKSSVKNLKKILNQIENKPGKTTCVNSTHDVVNNCPGTVLDLEVKVIGRPKLNDVKKAKGNKDEGEIT